jgi:hypothetical protein
MIEPQHFYPTANKNTCMSTNYYYEAEGVLADKLLLPLKAQSMYQIPP